MPTRNRLLEKPILKRFFTRKEVLLSRRLKPMQPYLFFFVRSIRDKGLFSAWTLAGVFKGSPLRKYVYKLGSPEAV